MRTVALVALLLASLVQARAPTPYPFKYPPTRAIALLARLDSLGKPSIALTAAEKRLLQDVEDGQFQTLSLAEAGIVASGISDYRKRKAYLDRYEKLYRAARQAVAEVEGPRDRADALLRFLHTNAFQGGYGKDKTRLTDIFDEATFNCVSASVLYNAIGARLGLDVRGIVVKGHAFSALVEDGKRVDVETTSPEGFNPERKKRRVLLTKRGVVVGVGEFDPAKMPRREVRDAGLVALIYSNRSAMESRAKNFLAGAQLGLRALALDPDSAGAAVNTRSNLVNWVADCITRGRFEEGLQVVRVGLELEPGCEALIHNRRGVYLRWAGKYLEEGSEPKALAVLTRAAKEAPGDAAIFDKGLPLVYIRLTEHMARAGRHDAALEMMIRGVKGHKELKGNVRALIEQVAKMIHDKTGPADARAYLERTLKKVGDFDGAQQAGTAYVRHVARALGAKGKYLQALVAVDEHLPLLGRTPRERKEEAKRLSREVYDGWATAHAKQGKHEQAVAVYRKAMRQYPGDESLARATRDQWQVWARAHMQKKEWDRAAEVYTKALQMFPRDVSLKAGLDRCHSERRRAAKTVSDRPRPGLPPMESDPRPRPTMP